MWTTEVRCGTGLGRTGAIWHRATGRALQRIRNIGVGLRLAIAFGLVGLLLLTVIGVGLQNAAQEDRARDEIVEASGNVQAILEAKFHAVDLNGSEVAY